MGQTLDRERGVRQEFIDKGGNVRHVPKIVEETVGPITPVVTLANDGDDEYCQVFRTGEELDAFIELMKEARRQVFG